MAEERIEKKDSDLVFKISKPGKNVVTAGDRDLRFSSEWLTMGAYKTGTASITTDKTDGAYYSVSIPHGLGYVPVCEVFATPSYLSDRKYRAPSQMELDTDSGDNNVFWDVDATNLNVRARHAYLPGTPGSVTYTFYYTIFKEEI